MNALLLDWFHFGVLHEICNYYVRIFPYVYHLSCRMKLRFVFCLRWFVITTVFITHSSHRDILTYENSSYDSNHDQNIFDWLARPKFIDFHEVSYPMRRHVSSISDMGPIQLSIISAVDWLGRSAKDYRQYLFIPLMSRWHLDMSADQRKHLQERKRR